jgi:hypothetical protein
VRDAARTWTSSEHFEVGAKTVTSSLLSFAPNKKTSARTSQSVKQHVSIPRLASRRALRKFERQPCDSESADGGEGRDVGLTIKNLRRRGNGGRGLSRNESATWET